MNKNRKAAALRACLAMLVAVGLLGGAGVALAQEKPAAAPAAPASEIKDERALKRLQAMSDTLAGAKTLRFQYRGLLPVTGPTGQYVNLMASASVVMQRPDRLRVQARGDLFPSELFHDGKTVTVVAANPKVYAQREAAGSLVESFTRGPQPGGDLVTPFIDLLATDPFAVLTRDLTSAIWVGQSKVGGVVTDHLAFTSKDVDWEVWIGTKDQLPRLMVVSYRVTGRQPTFTVELSDWKLNGAVPASTFKAAIPKGAARVEFKLQGPAAAK